MFLIVMSHYTAHGIRPWESGILDLVYSSFLIGGTVGVDCFVLITGYFMINSSVTFNKIARLLYQVLCIAAIISLTAYCIGSPWFEPSTKQLIKSAIGILGNYWFINTYLVLMLLSPFLNKMLRLMNQKELLLFICALIFLNYIAPNLRIQTHFGNIGLFITLYSIAAYIRMYAHNHHIPNTKVAILITLLLLVEVLLIWLTHQHRYFSSLLAGFILGHHSLYLLAVSSLVFMFFSRLHINNSGIINYLGAATLGIYLFHEHGLMRPFLWQTMLNCKQAPFSDEPYLHCLVAIPTVFCLSLVADMFYRHSFVYLYTPLYRYIIAPIYSSIKKVVNSNF